MPAASEPRLRVLIRRFHPVIGGMERQCRAVCAGLTTRGVQCDVWTRRIVPGSPPVEVLDGIQVHRVRPGGTGRTGEYGSLPGITVGLMAGRADYDVAAVFGSGWLAVAAGLGAMAAGRPWLFRPATVGDLDRFLDPTQVPAGGALRRRAKGYLPPSGWRRAVLRRAGVAVAISDEIAAELSRWGWPADRVVRVDNGVDTKRFRPADEARRCASKEELNLPAEGVLVLFLGRLVAHKGVLDLMTAWQHLLESGAATGATLAIVGSGGHQTDSVADQVVRAAKELGGRGIGSPVVVPGAVDDVATWLAAADILALPSHAEGLSNALLEAMASGLAIVASDLPTNGHAAGRAAEMHPPGDVPALAAALARLLADGSRRRQLGQEARRRAVASFSLDAAVDRYLALLRDLARKQSWT